MSVDIAMATYNGEESIESQIRSIINQTFTDWRLLISDDGSKDNTIQIIKKLMNEDGRIFLVNQEPQGGVIPNFNKALEFCSAKYIALSDQDDIWLPEHLSNLLDEINKYDNYRPQLVFSDLSLIDQNSNLMAKSFYKLNNINPLDNLIKNILLWKSSVYGCSTIFNQALLKIAYPVPNDTAMHDQWLALWASKYKGLNYLNQSTILYRQHSNNIVGGSKQNLFSKIKNFESLLNKVKNSSKNTRIILKDYKGIYRPNKNVDEQVDIIAFAIKEVFPQIFVGNKKFYTIIFLYTLLMYK